eukprot:gene17752-23351_t
MEEDFLSFSNSMVESSATFPVKLFALMMYECGDIIDWLPHGMAFRINDVNAFAREIVPRYFKQSKLTSFQRQLNLYGFRRLTKGEDQGAYFHPKFQRNRKDLLLEIRRLPGKGSAPPVDYSGYEDFLTPRFNTMPHNNVNNSNHSTSYNLRTADSVKVNKQFENYALTDPKSTSLTSRKLRANSDIQSNQNKKLHSYNNNSLSNPTNQPIIPQKRSLDENSSHNTYNTIKPVYNTTRIGYSYNQLSNELPKSKSRITMNIGYEHKIPAASSYPPYKSIQSSKVDSDYNNLSNLKNNSSLDSLTTTQTDFDSLMLPLESVSFDEYNRKRFGIAKSGSDTELELDQIDFDSMFSGLPVLP